MRLSVRGSAMSLKNTWVFSRSSRETCRSRTYAPRRPLPRPIHALTRTTPPLAPQASSILARRRLWTAGRITALSASGARLPALSLPARPLPTHPPSHFPLPNSHFSPPPYNPASTRRNVIDQGNAPGAPIKQPPALKGRNTLRTSSRRLWTAVSISALSACGARLPLIPHSPASILTPGSSSTGLPQRFASALNPPDTKSFP